MNLFLRGLALIPIGFLYGQMVYTVLNMAKSIVLELYISKEIITLETNLWTYAIGGVCTKPWKRKPSIHHDTTSPTLPRQISKSHLARKLKAKRVDFLLFRCSTNQRPERHQKTRSLVSSPLRGEYGSINAPLK